MRCYIDGNVANGGLSKVYHGFDIDRQIPVAIKIYRRDCGEFDLAQEEVDGYLTNSVRVHEFLDPNSRKFPSLYGHTERTLVMEFVEGVGLRDLNLKEREDLVLTAGYQMVLCLDELHKSRPEKSIIHRDVKPGNVIIRPTGEAVLCDFDLVYIDEQSVDGSERIVGTPQFVSPEHIRGVPVLPISDLFSVGSSLFLLFTEEALRCGAYSALHIEESHQRHNLSPGSVREVIETCWRIGRTYESAEHMVVELADRLRRIGIDPEKSHEVLAGVVKSNPLGQYDEGV